MPGCNGRVAAVKARVHDVLGLRISKPGYAASLPDAMEVHAPVTLGVRYRVPSALAIRPPPLPPLAVMDRMPGRRLVTVVDVPPLTGYSTSESPGSSSAMTSSAPNQDRSRND